MLYICCLITLFACSIGTICGMGGGIIIKPVLDAAGVMPVATITFLSGCTVIAMTCWNVGKTICGRQSVIDLKHTTYLAVSAAIGGLIGRDLFRLTASLFQNSDTAGGIQAVLLLMATLATFIYTLKKENIQSKKTDSVVLDLIIGLILGIFGSFLGIGGGPFNVAVLYYFFSMPTKKATQNSLYIILFSQTASTIRAAAGGIPLFDKKILIWMIIFAIAGSELGRFANKKINERQATRLFEGAMIFIMCINIYNIFKFL